MRAGPWPTWLIAALLLVGPLGGDSRAAPPAVPAQETQEPESPSFEASPDQPSTADRTVDELSDAERLLRMQQVVDLDTTKLERLRVDLASRKAFLDELTGRMAEFQNTWGEMKARLAELEASSEEVSILGEEIAVLERRYDRFNRHATLTFRAEESLRKQIVNLEGKIGADRRALAVFRGQGTESTGVPVATVVPAPSVPTPASPSGFSLVPGLPMRAPGVPSAPDATSVLPETADQIAARQELERKKRTARFAEDAVATFVERKEGLELQIGLEQALLEVDDEALQNLEGYVQEQREEQELRRAAGAGEEVLAEAGAQISFLEVEIVRVRDEVSRRRVELLSLGERLEHAIGELTRVTDIAKLRREEAESARKWLVWLESPVYPGNLARWAVERGPRVLAVLLLGGLAILVLRVSLKRIARLVVTRSRKAKSAVNRADTLALSFESLATTLILAACTLLVLQEAGIDVQTVLGGAAILGVAIAFGAQNLMRDYFTGFMMLLEDQYELGDLVTIGKITGTVERVNMRVTMLRDLEGRVHFIPNGQIGSLTNRTYDWARALVEIPVGPEQDVDRVMALLLEVARELNADPEWSKDIEDEPQMLGVDAFTESGVVIKLMLKTQPDRMFPVRRELLRRVKNAFDKAGIQPGVPQRVVRQNAPQS